MSDPYKVLGVSPNATDEEVKTAYGNWLKSIIQTIMRIVLWQIWPGKR